MPFFVFPHVLKAGSFRRSDIQTTKGVVGRRTAYYYRPHSAEASSAAAAAAFSASSLR